MRIPANFLYFLNANYVYKRGRSTDVNYYRKRERVRYRAIPIKNILPANISWRKYHIRIFPASSALENCLARMRAQLS